MKLLSFIRPDGSKSYGLLQGDGVIDLGLRLSFKFRNIKELLKAEALGKVRTSS